MIISNLSKITSTCYKYLQLILMIFLHLSLLSFIIGNFTYHLIPQPGFTEEIEFHSNKVNLDIPENQLSANTYYNIEIYFKIPTSNHNLNLGSIDLKAVVYDSKNVTLFQDDSTKLKIRYTSDYLRRLKILVFLPHYLFGLYQESIDLSQTFKTFIFNFNDYSSRPKNMIITLSKDLQIYSSKIVISNQNFLASATNFYFYYWPLIGKLLVFLVVVNLGGLVVLALIKKKVIYLLERGRKNL